jgi:hypothetical protein
MLRHLDLIQQIGVTIQHFEQLDQSQRRLGPAVLLADEGMVAAAAKGSKSWNSAAPRHDEKQKRGG